MTDPVNTSTDAQSAARAADLTSSLGRRVAEARRKLGLSQDQLATRSGASKGTIVQIEQGRANPSITSLCRLAIALHMSVEDLVSEAAPAEAGITISSKAKVLWRGPKGGRASLIIGARGPNMLELWQWRLASGERYASPGHLPGTREIVSVEKGVLGIEIGGVQHILRAGAAAVYDADRSHVYSGQTRFVTTFTMVVEEPQPGRR
ncbi:MAG: helix-turn-helix domain-containing protein [Hyphomicrobiaceae bacterium]